MNWGGQLAEFESIDFVKNFGVFPIQRLEISIKKFMKNLKLKKKILL